MKYVCRHCSGNAFKVLTGIDGRPAVECLNCGRASSIEHALELEHSGYPATRAEAE